MLCVYLFSLLASQYFSNAMKHASPLHCKIAYKRPPALLLKEKHLHYQHTNILHILMQQISLRLKQLLASSLQLIARWNFSRSFRNHEHWFLIRTGACFLNPLRMLLMECLLLCFRHIVLLAAMSEAILLLALMHSSIQYLLIWTWLGKVSLGFLGSVSSFGILKICWMSETNNDNTRANVTYFSMINFKIMSRMWNVLLNNLRKFEILKFQNSSLGSY